MVLVVCFVFSFAFFQSAHAANDQTVSVVGGAFSLSSAWGGALNVGPESAEVRTIGVQHSAGTSEGSLVVLPTDTLTFSYVPLEPAGILDKGIFIDDPLRGKWAGSLNDRSSCSADPSLFTIGADQYSFVLCGTQPSFSLISSDTAIMSCSGMTCTAKAAGNARITATIAGTPVKIWGNKLGEANWPELVSATLPGTTLSWDTTVVLPPTLTFSMGGTNPIPYNTNTTLSWSAQNVNPSNPCVASGDWNGTKGASGSFDTGNLTARRDYTLTCTGPSGDRVSRTVTVLVGSSTPSPQFGFSAGSTLVSYNTATTLSWNVSNPAFTTRCEASGGWSGSRPLSGSQSTGNLTLDTAYILECFGPGGSQAKQVIVRVIPPPSPPDFRTFSVDPDHILYNASSTITWEVRSAASCTAFSDAATPFANWNGAVPLSGSRTISGLTSTTMFSLSCRNAVGDTDRQDVTVRVEPKNLQPPTIVFFDADSKLLNYNEATTIHLKVDQADWCEGSGDWSWWTDTEFEGDYDTGNLATSKDYVLHCENLAGSIDKTVHVSVNNPTVPVVIDYFTVDPSTVDSGGSVTARWNVRNAQWCYMDWSQNGVPQPRVDVDFSVEETWDNLTQSEVDILTCGNSFGAVSKSVAVTVNPASPGPPLPPEPDPIPLPDPPIISFTRDSSYVSYNTATTLRWNVVNADTCVASNDQGLSTWNGSRGLLGTATTGNLRAETTFSLECTGPGGTVPKSVLVRVADPSQAGPNLSFWADSISLLSGESTRLRWMSTDATACTASGDWSGAKALQSPAAGVSTGALSSSKSYRLRCSSPGGAVVVTVNISVNAPPPTPSLSFYADDTAVPVNGSTMLRWNAQNVKSCVASGDWSGAKALSGGESTGSLTVERKYEYTLECTNGLSGGTVLAKAGISIGGAEGFGPTIADFAADASIIPFGTSPILRLTAYYSDQCCLSVNDNGGACLPSGSGGTLVPTSGTFDKASLPAVIHDLTAPVTYYAVCSYTDGFGNTIWSTSSAPVRVVKVLLCPASTDRNIVLGSSLQFDAWYTENSTADCTNVSDLGGVNVTTTGSAGTTKWSVVSGGVSVSNGLVQGNSPGQAKIRVEHQPAAATAWFSEEADVVVGRPVTCYRCDQSSNACSSETQFDFVHNPAECASDTFISLVSCRFACFKDRWQEVAP